MKSNASVLKAIFGMAFFFIITFSLGCVYVGYWFSSGLESDGNGKPFLIRDGWPVQTISRELHKEGFISHPRLFALASRLFGDSRNIHAGEYLLSASMSPCAILEKMVRGDVILHKITLPEGVSTIQFINLLNDVPELVGVVKSVPAEGALLPETYTFTRETQRSALLNEIQGKMNDLVDELWKQRPLNTPLSSKQEFVTLASIVEKETAIPAERPLVAAVFLNRLNKGMPLQADPTVVYGLTQGKGSLGRPLLKSDLQTNTPYNTYLHRGLPKGPIANPGKASLEAVIYPADVDYLYFVADGSGGHIFAETLNEHKKNHAKWRKIRYKQ